MTSWDKKISFEICYRVIMRYGNRDVNQLCVLYTLCECVHGLVEFLWEESRSLNGASPVRLPTVHEVQKITWAWV